MRHHQPGTGSFSPQGIQLAESATSFAHAAYSTEDSAPDDRQPTCAQRVSIHINVTGGIASRTMARGMAERDAGLAEKGKRTKGAGSFSSRGSSSNGSSSRFSSS